MIPQVRVVFIRSITYDGKGAHIVASNGSSVSVQLHDVASGANPFDLRVGDRLRLTVEQVKEA